MKTTTSIQLQSLLDRLDLRLDEPCIVPGCVHLHEPRSVEGVAVELQAAA